MGNYGYEKTILAQKMALDWHLGVEHLQDFEKRLLSHCHSLLPKVTFEVVERMIRDHGSNILVILDAYDGKTLTQKQLHSAVKDSIFSRSRWAVTSTIISDVENLKPFSKTFRIQGLTREKSEAFIESFFRNESTESKTEDYWKYDEGTSLYSINKFLYLDSTFDQHMSIYLLNLVSYSIKRSSDPTYTNIYGVFRNVLNQMANSCTNKIKAGLNESNIFFNIWSYFTKSVINRTNSVDDIERVFVRVGKVLYYGKGFQYEYDGANFNDLMGDDVEFLICTGIFSKVHGSDRYQLSHRLFHDYLILIYMKEEYVKRNHHNKSLKDLLSKNTVSTLQHVFLHSDDVYFVTVDLFWEISTGCISILGEFTDGKFKKYNTTLLMGVDSIKYRKELSKREHISRNISGHIPDEMLSYYRNYSKFLTSELIDTSVTLGNNFTLTIFKPYQDVKSDYVFLGYDIGDISFDKTIPTTQAYRFTNSSELKTYFEVNHPNHKNEKLYLRTLFIPLIKTREDYYDDLSFLFNEIFDWPDKLQPDLDADLEVSETIAKLVDVCIKEGNSWDFYIFKSDSVARRKRFKKTDFVLDILVRSNDVEFRVKGDRRNSTKIRREEVNFLNTYLLLNKISGMGEPISLWLYIAK